MSYPEHSTAARTKMLTICKRCEKSNDNGYQYCTACHKTHKRGKAQRRTPRATLRPNKRVSSAVALDDVLKVLGNEGTL
jgi:cytochrome c553